MCGIAGLVDFRRGAPPTGVLQAMCRAMAHRGPDDHGVMAVGSCGLAQARLSIIDLELSIQPMRLPDGVALTFNGEVYNYPKLRAALEARGHSFKTNGDTEVLLHMLDEQWADALPQLDAMFAFAAWDPDKRRALLARDPLGEKPLFYATPAPGLLIFGSEPKALLEHPEVDSALHLGALRQALRFRAVYGAQSLHTGVRQLPPGHYLEFDEQGLRIAPFHDQLGEAARVRPALRAKTEAELIQDGERLFMQSVEERLIADVPVGSFLSGGLDSSLIAAAVCKLRPDAKLQTFSVGFTDDPHSELPFAQMVADALGTQHRAIAVGPDQFIAHMAELSHYRDGPVSEPADVAIA
ncbi:MAG: asparagine synthase (glutamine-hydrolyzing), partial [Proteobacteria bacterium]|nr:asparagine synthase (glutamine-hydrolyzing) [Pseudomonadota bacterium]